MAKVTIGILLVVFAAASILRGQNNPVVSSGPGGPIDSSPQAAADYILKVLHDWDKSHPIPTQVMDAPRAPNTILVRSFTKEDIDSVAHQFAAVGVANLIAIIAGDKVQAEGDLRPLLDPALWEAVNLTATDKDLPLFLDAARSNTRFLPFIASHDAWRQQPQFISLVGDDLDHLSAPSGDGRSALQANSPGASSGKTNDATFDLFALLAAARATGDPGLAGKVDALFQSAGGPNGPLNFDNIRKLYDSSVRHADGENYKYVPSLLDALTQEKFHKELDTYRDYMVQELNSCLLGAGAKWICGLPEMQDAVHRLADPAKSEDDPYQAEWLLASVGDQDSFQRLIEHYGVDKKRPGEASGRLGPERDVLASVVYKGPDDDRFQTIVDNASQCTFDNKLGRWVLTVPGYESADAITNESMPPLIPPKVP